MKTKFITSVMAMLFLASASLMANDPSPIFEIVNQKGSSVYKLVYKSSGQGKVNLRITDKTGTVLYTKLVNYTHGFTYPLDFKGMDKGVYTVEVSDKDNKLKQSLTYEFKNPTAYVHVANQPNKKYMLTIASQVPANFTIRIYDRWNREVLEKKESVTNDFGLVYNLSKVDGPFTFEVTEAAGTVDIVRR